MSLILSLAIALAPVAQADDPVDRRLGLNDASAVELSALEGVELGEAEAIVRLREGRGRLSSVEALRVLSLDEPTLNALRDGTAMDLPLHKVAAGQYRTVDEVLAQFVGEPDVRAVQAMAMHYSKTNPKLVEGWLSASRQAFLLPKLNLQYEKEIDATDDYAYILNNAGELESQQDGADRQNDDKYVVKLEWRLEKLIMSSERIRVINESQDIVKLRDKVLDEVTRVYFDRRRLQTEMLLDPPSGLSAQVDNELRMQELTAGLDALTGGGFSAGVATGASESN